MDDLPEDNDDINDNEDGSEEEDDDDNSIKRTGRLLFQKLEAIKDDSNKTKIKV